MCVLSQFGPCKKGVARWRHRLASIMKTCLHLTRPHCHNLRSWCLTLSTINLLGYPQHQNTRPPYSPHQLDFCFFFLERLSAECCPLFRTLIFQRSNFIITTTRRHHPGTTPGTTPTRTRRVWRRNGGWSGADKCANGQTHQPSHRTAWASGTTSARQSGASWSRSRHNETVCRSVGRFRTAHMCQSKHDTRRDWIQKGNWSVQNWSEKLEHFETFITERRW